MSKHDKCAASVRHVSAITEQMSTAGLTRDIAQMRVDLSALINKWESRGFTFRDMRDVLLDTAEELPADKILREIDEMAPVAKKRMSDKQWERDCRDKKRAAEAASRKRSREWAVQQAAEFQKDVARTREDCRNNPERAAHKLMGHIADEVGKATAEGLKDTIYDVICLDSKPIGEIFVADLERYRQAGLFQATLAARILGHGQALPGMRVREFVSRETLSGMVRDAAIVAHTPLATHLADIERILHGRARHDNWTFDALSVPEVRRVLERLTGKAVAAPQVAPKVDYDVKSPQGFWEHISVSRDGNTSCGPGPD